MNNRGLFALFAVILIFASHLMVISLYFHSTEITLEDDQLINLRQKSLDSLVNPRFPQLPPVTILYYATVSRWLGKHMLVTYFFRQHLISRTRPQGARWSIAHSPKTEQR
jgi:hypothetical protein